MILRPWFWIILRVMCCTVSILIALFVCRHQCDRMKGNISRYIKQHKIRIKIIGVGWHFRKHWKYFTRITWQGERIWRNSVKIQSSGLMMRRYGLLRLACDRIRGIMAGCNTLNDGFLFPRRINDLQIKPFFLIFDVARACVPEFPCSRVNECNTHTHTHTHTLTEMRTLEPTAIRTAVL